MCIRDRPGQIECFQHVHDLLGRLHGVPPGGGRRFSTANRTSGGASTAGRGEADGIVSGRSHDRQRAVFMSATGQLRGRLRAVCRVRCHPHVPAAGSPTEDRQGYRRALAGPSAVGVCWAPIVIWLSGGLGSVFVVIPTGSYANLVVCGLVDEAVLVCDASRPVALRPMSEWLGLTDSVVAVAGDVLDQGVDPFERLAVLTLPPQIVLPGAFIPDELHSARSCSTPSPSSSRLIESSRRRAFAGLLSRYAVSFSDS